MPYLGSVIEKGRDARHLWFALKKWDGDDPEEFFGGLASWAERRLRETELGAVTGRQKTNFVNMNPSTTNGIDPISNPEHTDPETSSDGDKRHPEEPHHENLSGWMSWVPARWPWGVTANP